MLDLSDDPRLQIEKQQKIIAALMHRFEREHDMGGSAYALFQSAVKLESQVRETTQDLERALNTIGERNTELQNIHSERQRDQQSLADTLEVMNEGYALIKEGYLTVFNDRFRRLFPDIQDKIYVGLPVEDFLDAVSKSVFLDLPSEKERESWKEGRLMALGSNRSNFVLPLINDRWYNVTYQRTSFGNTAIMQSNITDLVRKNREEKNQIIGENTILLQAVFEHLSLAICLLSKRGKIKMCNQRFLEFSSLSLVELHQTQSFNSILKQVNDKNLMIDAIPPAEARKWARDLQAGQDMRRRIDMTNGLVFDMRLMALPDDDFIVTFEDITAETNAKKALLVANERLEERVNKRTADLLTANEKLKDRARQQKKFEHELLVAKNAAEAANQSKTRFLAAASHDLLQPINAAKLYVSTLQDIAISDETKDLAVKISKSFDSAENLLQSLLEISRLEANSAKFTIAEFPLSEILANLEIDFAHVAEVKGLKFSVVDSGAWVRSDRTYLRRIIFNLVTNAIEHTMTGRVLVGCRLAGDSIRIEVWDTGPGISKKDHKVIFEEFHRLPKANDAKGIGLGLSIVERACNQLDHTLSMRSKPGIGSVFSVEVKTVDMPDKRKVPELITVEGTHDTHGLIAMVIENDASVLNAMIQKLDTWGLGVLPASSTKTALKALRDMGLPPDIIIADYQLDRDDNGFLAIEAVREAAQKDVPAILVTGNQTVELEPEAERLGVEILRKPVPLRKLRALIGWKTRAGLTAPAQN